MPSSAAADLHPSQKKVDKIKNQEDAKRDEEVAGKNKYLKKKSHSFFLQSSSPNPQVALNSVLKNLRLESDIPWNDDFIQIK